MTKPMEIWFEPENPVGYSSVKRLSKKVKETKKETENWLKRQLAYSLNRPMRKRFPTRKYKTSGINHLWQADLMEMNPYSSINDGYNYILTCVDVFSRFARAVPVKTKGSNDMKEAISELMKDDKPINFQTDLGKEFYNAKVTPFLKKQNINHYSVVSQYKAALVERFNRTLRDKLKKYFTYKGNKRWVDVLPKIIDSYNHSEHRGLDGLRPIDVNNDNESEIWYQRNQNIKTLNKPRYKVGDFVRISQISASPFVKNFKQNWSDEVYTISSIDTKQSPFMYTLSDPDDNEIVRGKFYDLELQVLPERPDIYRIESVLREKGKGRNKQLLVKWYGYDEPSWIKASDLV